ncbi:ParM/StbA family protein [Metabacillus fastidiosus]|uniref:ParM/StbA family protein n=1 Tax=Metabacillus fastidiosus TaxID=1458 RepID=UPI003D266A62
MGKNPTLKLLVSNDNGNSEHSLYINNELVRQPNVLARPNEGGFIADVPAESLVPNLLNNIDVTILSPSVRFNRRYYIGHQAINSKFQPTSMNVSLDKKYKHDLPIINTIGVLAAKAVMNHFNKTKIIPAELNVSVDMLTALPIEQWNPENAKVFKDRFSEKPHTVTVHINGTDSTVKLNFDMVKVAPEGTPALFSIVYDMNGEYNKGKMFEQFKEDYGKEITGEYLLGKRILHVDIGDGTCDTPVTDGFNLDRRHVSGCNNGVGHAITEAMRVFLKDNPTLTKTSRQKYSEYLKDTTHQYHEEAVACFNDAMLTQAEFIFEHFRNVISYFDNEVDVIAVYGGGSILMREILYPLLKEVADDLSKELLWVPEEVAPLMNVNGLQVILNKQTKKEVKA